MPGVTTTAEAGLDNSAVAKLNIPTPETGENLDKSKVIETSQGLHGQAEVNPYADLDHATKVSLLGQINEVAFATGELQKGQTDAYKNDRVFYDTVANIYNNPEHKEFFGLAQQAAQEGDAGEAAQQQLEKLQLTEFSREEMVVLDAALRKRANQLAYAMGLRRVGTNRYIEWQGEEEMPVSGWFGRTRMEKTGNKIDLFKQGTLTLADLRGEGFVADLHPPVGPARSLNAPLAEAIRFHDDTRYTEPQRLRMLAEAHNASIAFREHAFNMKAEDTKFGNDRLSIDIDKQLERLLEQRGIQINQLTTLPDREYIEIYEQATSAAISNQAELVTVAVIENRRDTEFLREDWMARAEQNAEDLRAKATKTKKWTRKEPDGTETPIGTETEYQKQKSALDMRTQTIQDRIDATNARIKYLGEEIQNAPTRISEIETQEQQLYTQLITNQAILDSMTDFSNATKASDRRIAIGAEDIVEGKDKTGKTTFRKRQPAEIAEQYTKEENRWKETSIKVSEAMEKLEELARLKSNTPQTELETARKKLDKHNKDKAKVATIAESEETTYPTGVEEVIKKIDYITGHEDQNRTYVKKLNHVAEVIYKPHLRSRALESFDNLQQTLFITEEDPKLHKQIVENEAIRFDIMAQSIADGLGVRGDDWIRIGFDPAEVSADGKVIWSAILAGAPALIEQRMNSAETYLLEQLRERSPFVTTNVVMGILHERLHAASMVDASQQPPVDALKDYAVTAVSFKPGLRERS